MMTCETAAELLDAWEAGRDPTEAQLGALRAHAAGCARCGRSLGPLILLLERDAAEESVAPGDRPRGRGLLSAGAGSAGRERADRVMASLPDRGSAGRGARRRRRSVFRPAAAAAIAAAALVAVGVGLGSRLGAGEPAFATVRFVLDAPEARTVALAGDFNSWKTEGWQLSRAAPRAPWTISVRLKRGSLYSYNFVVDGELWIPDPSTPETASDGFGGTSSLLRL